jgi:replicative DNA helicase
LLIPHAHAAFGLLGADATDTDATAVVKWARDGGRLSFSKSECQKAMEGRFRSIARLEKAIERLEQGDVVKVEKVPNRGARPTTRLRMNPKLFFE